MPVVQTIISVLVTLFALSSFAFAADPPKVAVFPLAGSADVTLRDRCGFSIRMKLDRDGTYTAIDGPTMFDLASDAPTPVNLDSSPDLLKQLAADEKPAILIWGQIDAPADGGKGLGTLRVKILDLRDPDAKPRLIEKPINQPTDVRFIVEGILETLPGIKSFDHPDQEAVHHDAASDAAWNKNPNLVADGDFSDAGHWTALFRSEVYPAPLADALPDPDKIVIFTKAKDAAGGKNVLAMNLTKDAAESNGLACLSDAFQIQPNEKYRLQFKYNSSGPSLQCFVKGYIDGKDLQGNPELEEVWRRQLPGSGSTRGKWTSVECDMAPQNTVTTPKYLKVDLFAYLGKGRVMFADVQVKDIGPQTAADQIKDAALLSATQPSK